MTRQERHNKFSLKQVARYVCQTLLLSFVLGTSSGLELAAQNKVEEEEEQSTVRLLNRRKRGTDELGK